MDALDARPRPLGSRGRGGPPCSSTSNGWRGARRRAVPERGSGLRAHL